MNHLVPHLPFSNAKIFKVQIFKCIYSLLARAYADHFRRAGGTPG